MTPHSTDRCALCNKQLANHTAAGRHCPLPGRPGRAGIRSYHRTNVFTPKRHPECCRVCGEPWALPGRDVCELHAQTPMSETPPVSPSSSPKVSQSLKSGAKRRGRPRKPKASHAVTLTLTLPNAAHRRHLKRLAKAAGHKTPGAFIAAQFPLPPRQSSPSGQ